MYFIILVLSYIFFYFIFKKKDLTLLFTLLVLYFITAFHYHRFLFVIPILVYSFFYLLNLNILKYIKFFNFLILFYSFISINEFILHKFVMHCNTNNVLSKIINRIPFLNNEYAQTCNYHKTHHLEVEPDMSLSENKNKNSLFMGWNVYPIIIICIFISGALSKWISNYPISYIVLFLISILVSFIWSYIWNKVHVKMHQSEIEYSIKKGPYDENLFTLDPVKDLLLENHQKHHLQKGENKGNYNVIVLGADEWFGYNVKKVNNEEYCISHTNEKICNPKSYIL